MTREEKIEKIIDEVEKEFECLSIPIMDKLTIFAKVQNALYKCGNYTCGEWIERKLPTQTYFVCSECGKPMCQMDKNFCAHCGADMREETTDEDNN